VSRCRGIELSGCLSVARGQLEGSLTPLLDAEVLLAYVLREPRSYLFAHGDRLLTQEQRSQFEGLVERRVQGEPIAYIIGHKEFWSLDLLVNSNVLIPRPETELLVELALELMPNNGEGVCVLDLGTGSGAVALTLAKERPSSEIVATDYSSEALDLARHNAKRLGLHNIKFILSDWLKELSGKKFNIIVSNPPYIAEKDPCLKQKHVQFEPKQALIGGVDGLDVIRIIAKSARAHLNRNGSLLLEHGYNQGQATRDILRFFGYKQIKTKRDMAKIERITQGNIC
jgi:release factor glutamine methyltransferase